MPYATIAQLRGLTGVLETMTNTDTNRDTMLQACLDDAQAIIDGELGITLVAVGAAGDRVVYGDGTAYLTLPPHTLGTVTEVEAPDDYTVPDYIQQNGVLVTTDANGIIPPVVYPSDYWRYNPFATSAGLWAAGVPYTVTATFGTSASDMNVLRRITLDLAVKLWKFRDAGGAVAVGTESAIVLVKDALPPWASMALETLKRKYVGSVGIW